MITKHLYIDRHKINPSAEKLILDTIHPHNTDKFIVDFFYGNRGSIWKILHDAFPDELTNPTDLKVIQQFLDKRKIAVSDTVLECGRRKPTASDNDFIDIVPNLDLKREIRDSRIEIIYFTSGSGKNNAFHIFYEQILDERITTEIRERRELIFKESHFGRPVKGIIMYSPSGQANISLSKNMEFITNKERYGNKRPVHEF